MNGLAEKQRFAELMIGVGELYGKKLSPQLIEIYWLALARYELAAVEKALNQHAVNPDGGQFMPKPADLIRRLDGGGEGRAGEAWTKVYTAVRLHGGWSSVKFKDPIISAVIMDMGGWVVLCETLQDPTAEKSNFPFMAREFERRYRAYLETGRAPEVRELTGRADSDNLRIGHKPQGPVHIGGDWELAKLAKETA